MTGKELAGKNAEYRALMVIKKSNKTMAKQRKDAIIYWKVSLSTYLPV